ncbi:unnamed protein product [Lactuca virosa]|uniref:Uncharacterized protein n=1 Tax=Lactuca virosa TaxID=75947 RepID=A0AAU9PK91_9ASTR|nr:unnamed protein product [Lactuca virosa]
MGLDTLLMKIANRCHVIPHHLWTTYKNSSSRSFTFCFFSLRSTEQERRILTLALIQKTSIFSSWIGKEDTVAELVLDVFLDK